MGHPVRQATTADLPRIEALWVELTDYEHHLDPRHWQRAPDGAAKFGQWMQEAIEGGQRVVLVAEEAGKVIGFGHGLLQKSPPPMTPRLSGFVTDLVVEGAFRGKGVGTSLLNALESWFADHGADSVTLGVAARSDAALGFYYSHGFEHWTSTLWKPLKTTTLPEAH